MTDEELDEFLGEMGKQGDLLREALDEDLRGDPEDYRRQSFADGGK